MDNISLSLLTLYEALANSPYTTITGDLDTTATSITIVDPAAIPSTFPCLLTIGYDTSTAETVLATSISGDTLTVTRGVDGTLQTWTAGSRISRVFTAKDLNDIQTNISRIAAAIGSASLDTEAQTLVGAINELDAGKCKLVKGYLSSSTGAFYSDSGFTTLVTDNENPNNLYLDLNSYRLYKYIAVGTGVLDVGYNLITVDDDLDVIRTPKYGVCSTAAGTAAKAVTINGITSLVTGLTIAVKFSNNNTAASPTLQVNSLTAKPIYQHGTTPAGTDDATTGWYAGAVVILAYDGTGWVMSKGVNNALDAGDVVYDNQETYASGTVGKEVSDLNGAISDLTPPNNIGLVGQQNYNTIESNLSGSGTSEIFIINETENNNWSYIESLISGTHKYAILSGQNGVVTFRSTDSGTTWRMIKLSNDNYATVEYGTTASKPYVVGEYVVVDSVLYRVKANISNGDTFTVGTNIESTTVGNELKSLLVPVEHTLTAQTGITVGSMQCYTLGKLCFIRINNASFDNDGNSQVLITGVPQPLIQTGATGIAGSNAVNTGAIMSAGDTAYIEASTDIIRFHVNVSTKSYAHWFSFVYLTK